MKRTLTRWRTWVWVLPAVLLLLVFVYYPIVENFRLSLFSWNAFSPRPIYVGLDNYRTAIDDPVFWRALRNNTVFAITSLVFQVGFSLVLAAVLEEFVHQKLRGILRTIYFIPAVISITVAGILFSFLYNPQIGLVNEFLGAIGLDSWQHSWLGEPDTAMWSIIAMSQWQSIGYTAVLFVVAIQRVPREFYEAARVDGAAGLQAFTRITWPLVRPILLVTLLFRTLDALRAFDIMFVLTGGGPAGSTESLTVYAYRALFQTLQVGFGSAIGVVVFALVMVVAALYLRLIAGQERVA